MDTFNELQHLWQGAEAAPPIAAKDLIQKIKKSRRAILAKLAGSILALIATLPVMGWIFLAYHPKYPTTRFSIVLCMIIVTGGILMQSHSLRTLLLPLREDVDNRSMLAALERVQVRQKKINNGFMSAYFILLSGAMALYIFEFIRGNILFGIAAYMVTFGWIAFAWFYLRPRTINKQNAALNSMIAQLRILQQDWEEKENSSGEMP